MAAAPKTYFHKPFSLKCFLLYLVCLVLVCSIGMLFIVPPMLYIFDVIPFLFLIIVWIIFLVFFTKRQKSTSLVLDESGLRYARHSGELVIPWNGIKYFKRYFKRNGSTRNIIIVPYSGRLLLLGNYSEIEEIANYVEQHAKSLGKLSTIERIRLSHVTKLAASIGVYVGFICLIYFPPITTGHFLSVLLMLVSGGLVVWSLPSTSAKSPPVLLKKKAKIFMLLLIVWIVMLVTLLIIFNRIHS